MKTQGMKMPSISSPLSFLFKIMTINVQEHLDDNELHQVMEIVGKALDRSRDQGFINGDIDNFLLSIKAHIPKED